MKRKTLLNLFIALSLALGLLAVQPTKIGYAQSAPVITEGESVAVTMSQAGSNLWTNHSPGGGTISAMAVDPLTPSTLYVAVNFAALAADAGIYKSSNGGSNWSQVWTGDVDALAIDPNTPTTVYFGGINGVFKSINGGGTWSESSTGLDWNAGRNVYALAINPLTPTILYAGAEGGVYKSTDGGDHWNAINNGLTDTWVHSLVIDPLTPSTLYIGLYNNGGVYKSVNSGGNWEAVNADLPDAYFYTLAIDPLTPSTLYAARYDGGVYQSTNSGVNWNTVNTGLPDTHFLSLAIDPATPSTLYVGGGNGVFQSTNSGGAWNAINTNLTPSGVLALAIDPLTPTTLYAGLYLAGVFKTTDSGGNWNAVDKGMPGMEVLSLAIDPATPTTQYAGTLAGVYKTTNSGDDWIPVNTGITTIDVHALAVDPSTPTILYAGTYGGVFKSSDGGGNWVAVNTGLGGEPYTGSMMVHALVINPVTPTILYIGTDGGLYKSINGGENWGITSPYIAGHSLVIDPSTTDIMYAGTSGEVYKSTDGGDNWSRVLLNWEIGFVNSLAIDPSTPTTIYAGTDIGGVYKSMDGGDNWNATNTGLTTTFISALAIDPLTPTTIYAGTMGSGVSKSTDGGSLWSELNDGLTASSVFILAIDPVAPATLYAGTEGGVFIVNPTVTPPVIAEGSSTSVTMSQNGSPNPFNLTLHATDVDADTLTWSISSPASHGTASASGTGNSKVISYTPDADYTGSDSFVVQVDDGIGGIDTITVNVTVMQDGNPRIDARIWENSIWGWGWQPNIPITVTIDDPDNGPGEDFTDTKLPDGGNVQFNTGDFRIGAGQFVTMTNGILTRTHTITSLGVATAVDVNADIVTGTAEPGSLVRVKSAQDGNDWIGREVTTDANGDWLADFSEPGDTPEEQQILDILPGSWGIIEQYDSDGDVTTNDTWGSTPHIIAQIVQNAVEGNWPAGASVTLTIDDPGNGTGVDFTDTQVVDGYTVRFNNLGDLSLAAGMLITATDGDTTKIHTVTDLIVTGANPALDAVSGTGTPGTRVDVQHCDDSGCPWIRHVIVQADDTWQADFSVAGAELDEQQILAITPGMQGQALQSDEDGDQTQVDWHDEVPGWRLRNQGGFGNPNNLIFAIEVFNDQLYAATSNWADGGARVWRLNHDNAWSAVSEVGMSSTYGQTNSAILDLVTFNGQLYASVGWGTNEGQIWRTSNGTDWSKVTDSEFEGATVMMMTVFNDTLYAGASVDAGGVEIWRSSTGDSGSWERVAQNGLGNPDNIYVSGGAIFNGALYVSLINYSDGISLWRTTDGTEWTQVSTYGFGDANNSDAGGLAILGGYLYASTKNTTTGGQIWRYDGTSWSKVVGDGFGDMNNIRVNSLYSVNNWLFAITENSVTGLQTWRSANGTDWTALNLNGFGNVNNNNLLWSNSSAVFENTFFVGTFSGEVWQYTNGSSPASLIVTPASTVIYPGDTLSAALNLQNTEGTYAAQASCSVDPAVLQPQGAVVGDFFDPANILIGANQVNPTTGASIIAISLRSPAGPVSGDGLFATIEYLAQGPGTATITCDPLLSDRNGFSQPVSFTGATITVIPFANLSGNVTYQGRADHSGITITATCTDTRTATTDGTGHFDIDLKAGECTFEASASGYLPVSTTRTVGSGQTITLPDVTLKGGSVSGDDGIDIGDATLIAANFGLDVPPADARADINGDNKVNVQDLAILGGNYGLSGEQPWQ